MQQRYTEGANNEANKSHINALARAPSTLLVRGGFVGRKPAVASWHKFIFVRIRRDDHSAAGGQTENQFSIGRDSNHSRTCPSPPTCTRLRVPLTREGLPRLRTL
jgi:hypothetical protein